MPEGPPWDHHSPAHGGLGWVGTETELEADPRHVGKLFEGLTMDDASKGLEGPATTESKDDLPKNEPEVEDVRE